jgi:hypothetical protein
MASRQHIRDWFALGCGLFGIWQLLRAADSMMFAFQLINGWYRTTAYTFAGEMLYAVGHFFLGLSLLASATKLATFWYPDTPNKKASDQNDSHSNTTNV